MPKFVGPHGMQFEMTVEDWGLVRRALDENEACIHANARGLVHKWYDVSNDRVWWVYGTARWEDCPALAALAGGGKTIQISDVIEWCNQERKKDAGVTA